MKKEEAMELAGKCLEDLAHALNAPCTVEVQRYLNAIAVFHRYSLNNILMILAQAPEASLVAGFHSWRKLGRFVKAGESGIAIFAPIVRGRKPRRDEADVESEQTKKAASRWLSGFKVVHVFDVSQTEGAPLMMDVAAQQMQFNALGLMRDMYGSLGIQLEYGNLPIGARGASLGGKVVLRQGLNEETEIRVLAHELAHELLHEGSGDKQRTPTLLAETEAEAVAFVVCKASGLDCQDVSNGYIRSYRGDARLVEQSFDRIRSTAGRILCLLEEAERSRAVATETAGVERITYADETGFDAVLHERSYGHAHYDLERIETSQPHPDVTDRFIREVRVQYIASEAMPFQIKKAEDVADFVRSVMIDNIREQFFALYLDGKHAVVSYSLISIGTANSAPVHPREVFQRAILSGAIAVVVAHNHPSGSSDASEADRRVTSELRAAGKLLEIQLLDHVIVTQSGCHSLRNCPEITSRFQVDSGIAV